MTDEPERMDAPNQQTVRPDGSGPADEGSGGSKPRRGDGEKGAQEPARRGPGRPRKEPDAGGDDG